MLWLTVHMWLLLISAFAIGIGAGWWVWGARTDATPPARAESEMGTLDSEFATPGDKGDLAE